MKFQNDWTSNDCNWNSMHCLLDIIGETECKCDFRMGGKGKNGITCTENGILINSDECKSNQRCIGSPVTYEAFLEDKSKLCEDGNILI